MNKKNPLVSQWKLSAALSSVLCPVLIGIVSKLLKGIELWHDIAAEVKLLLKPIFAYEHIARRFGQIIINRITPTMPRVLQKLTKLDCLRRTQQFVLACFLLDNNMTRFSLSSTSHFGSIELTAMLMAINSMTQPNSCAIMLGQVHRCNAMIELCMCSFLCVVASKIEGDVHCSGYADSEH
jgi:hypothetical protein